MQLKKYAAAAAICAATLAITAPVKVAAEETISVEADDTIISKGNPEGTTENLRRYIILYDLTEGGGVAIAEGKSHRFLKAKEYKVVGEFEITKPDKAPARLNFDISGTAAGKLEDICLAEGITETEAVEKALAAYRLQGGGIEE